MSSQPASCSASQPETRARQVERRESDASRAGLLKHALEPAPNPFIDRMQAVSRPNGDTLEIIRQICSEPVHVSARTEIAAEGASTDHLHILLDGWASRRRAFADGRRQITAFLLRGAVCDLESLHLDRRDQSVYALTGCEVAVIPRARLKEIMQRDAGAGEALGWFAALDNVMLSERNASLGQRPARERIAHLLCELATRLEAIGEGDRNRCRVPLTQEQIGEALGLTAVHVNRVLQGLREDNLVQKRGDRLTILDWDALAAVASFSPNYLHLGDRASDRRVGHSKLVTPSPTSELRAQTDEVPAADAELFDERAELRHRFKNFVAVAQSLVNQSLQGETSLEEGRMRLNRRLAAMGGAVDLLASGNWRKAGLRETIAEALRMSGASNSRIHCRGPDLKLNEQAVMALSMALHELQTNAMKYGALSSAKGSVDLFWKVIDAGPQARLWMQWAEHDGPEVQEPASQGFGTRLITSAIAQTLGGEARIDYTPAGLTWILTAPLDRIGAA